MNSRISNFRKWFETEKYTILFCLAATFICGLLAHSAGFLSTSFSHDSLNAIYADNSEVLLKIEVGRFIVPLYESVFRGFMTLPWLIGLLALFYLGLSLYIIVKMFDVKSRGIIAFMAGILTINVSFIGQTATFIHELDCNCLAFLFATMAAYMWQKKCNFKGLSLASLLLFLSLGTYQSFISVTIALIMFLSIFDLLNNHDAKAVIIKALKGVAALAVAAVVYYAVTALLCNILGTTINEEKNALAASGDANILVQYAKYFIKVYYLFFATLADFKVYNALFIIPFFMVTMGIFAFILLYIFKKNKDLKKGNKCLVLFIIAFLPFGMNVASFFSRGSFHDLMAYSFHLVYVMLLVAVCRLDSSEQYTFRYKKVLKYVSILLVSTLLLQNVNLAAQAYQKKVLEDKATLSVMTRVIDRMEERDDYEIGKTPVAFVGRADAIGILPEYDKVRYIVGMTAEDSIALDVSIYYYNTYKKYLKYVLKYPINICDDETHTKIKKNEEVDRMPAFPDKDCMKMIDGVLVVKMGM